MLFLSSLAFARDIDLKVHDMRGVVTGDVTVELGEPGQAPLVYPCRDDGQPPDAIAGDRLFTARVEGLPLDHGTVVVRAAGRVWQGGFRFEAQSDPVLLVGLEEGGFAAASTREVMFVTQGRTGGPGATPAPGGAPAPDPAAVRPAEVGPAPGGGSTQARKAPTRSGAPEGLWLGWGVAALALGALGVAAHVGAGRAPRIPPVQGAPRITHASRGTFTPASNRTDLMLGPGEGLRIADGRWTPEEVVLAALRVRGDVRVVVTDPALLEVEGDAYAALAGALQGVADLLWVDPSTTATPR